MSSCSLTRTVDTPGSYMRLIIFLFQWSDPQDHGLWKLIYEIMIACACSWRTWWAGSRWTQLSWSLPSTMSSLSARRRTYSPASNHQLSLSHKYTNRWQTRDRILIFVFWPNNKESWSQIHESGSIFWL